MTTLKTAALSLLLLTVSCGSMFNGKESNIRLESNPTGARIFLDGIEKGTTPKTIQVAQNAGGRLEFRLQGYESQEHQIAADFNAVALLDFLLPFVWPIAVVVDAATGNWTHYQQNQITVSLVPIKLEQ